LTINSGSLSSQYIGYKPDFGLKIGLITAAPGSSEEERIETFNWNRLFCFIGIGCNGLPPEAGCASRGWDASAARADHGGRAFAGGLVQ
jgi:hypothetical protein